MFSLIPRSFGFLLLLSWWTFSQHAIGGTASGPCQGSEARQFDFWVGEWDVLNKYLQEDGSYAEVGNATARIYPALDGCLIIEHWQGWMRGRPLYGFSMRAWDQEAGHWTLVLNWPAPARPNFGILTGVFTHGRGEFFSRFNNADGREVWQRYSFSDARGDTLRWDAATSEDRQEWRTNWIMEFTRRSPMQRALLNGPSPEEGPNLCPGDEFRSFDFLVGEWYGRPHDGEEAADQVVETFASYPIVRNCALLDFVERSDGSKQLRIRSYIAHTNGWVAYLFDTVQRRFRRLQGKAEGKRIEMEGEDLRVVWIGDDPRKPLREVYAREGEDWVLQSRAVYTPTP
ncbi:MAG TPA: hypothetical protein VLU25_02120 [Acidobacteriota bacterium]|nr:hypothetical protein [Acidobacteriota bacterium]